MNLWIDNSIFKYNLFNYFRFVVVYGRVCGSGICFGWEFVDVLEI